IFVAVFHRVDLDRFKELSPVSAASAQLHVSVKAWNCAWLICPLGFAKQDIVIGVRVKRRIEIQDRHPHWESPSDRKASEDCHRNKRDSFQTDGERFLHFGRNDKASPITSGCNSLP